MEANCSPRVGIGFRFSFGGFFLLDDSTERSQRGEQIGVRERNYSSACLYTEEMICSARYKTGRTEVSERSRMPEWESPPQSPAERSERE
jgi:hypothetical protein